MLCWFMILMTELYYALVPFSVALAANDMGMNLMD